MRRAIRPALARPLNRKEDPFEDGWQTTIFHLWLVGSAVCRLSSSPLAFLELSLERAPRRWKPLRPIASGLRRLPLIRCSEGSPGFY